MPEDLFDALHQEREQSGKSLNQTVIDLLRQRLGLNAQLSNGLARFAGTWEPADVDNLDQAIAPLEDIDIQIWQ